MEAEYIAMCEAGKEAVFLYEILQTILPADRLPIAVLGDNLGSVQLAHNPEFYKRSKHIDMRYHYIRQLVEDNIVDLRQISSHLNASDMLTKPLRADQSATALATLGIGPVQ
jgi:hypothetical protein